MRLNRASDFALRILILLAKVEKPQTIDDLCSKLGIPKTHAMKIIAKLSRYGFVETSRGRHGGVQLGRPANEVKLGDVVRITESDFAVVECLQHGKSCCNYLPSCALIPAMIEATDSFIECLNQNTLKTIVDKTQFPGEQKKEPHEFVPLKS